MYRAARGSAHRTTQSEINALQTHSKVRRYFGGNDWKRALLIVGML
jgi:hypothetical protein